jgi:hypothetical protein
LVIIRINERSKAEIVAELEHDIVDCTSRPTLKSRNWIPFY